jgi:hypothetical protein
VGRGGGPARGERSGLTDGQIITGMARIVALLHDDETLVDPPPDPSYPFETQ